MTINNNISPPASPTGSWENVNPSRPGSPNDGSWDFVEPAFAVRTPLDSSPGSSLLSPPESLLARLHSTRSSSSLQDVEGISGANKAALEGTDKKAVSVAQ